MEVGGGGGVGESRVGASSSFEVVAPFGNAEVVSGGPCVEALAAGGAAAPAGALVLRREEVLLGADDAADEADEGEAFWLPGANWEEIGKWIRGKTELFLCRL